MPDFPCIPCHQTPVWPALQAHAAQVRAHFDLRQAFAADGAARFARFSQAAPHCFIDLSKNLWDAHAHTLLLQLAQQCALARQRAALFGGEPINSSERRAALHTLLRAAPAHIPEHLIADSAKEQSILDSMLSYAECVRADAAITDIVCLGIGGSSLGPQLAAHVLRPPPAPGVPQGQRLHFVCGADGVALPAVLRGLQARNTLFIVSSKTFATPETLANLRDALAWFEAHRSDSMERTRHFVAITGQPQVAAQWGIRRCFTVADWIGGRYSLWSSIGLPVAIAAGSAAFRALLAGAQAMDAHFCHAPPHANAALRLGLLDVWNRCLLGFTSRCVAPYHSALAHLPAYLQQLEMESNGKRVDRRGRAVAGPTAPVIWGAVGSDAQHAFFQLLHQGSDVVPLDIIAVRRAPPGQAEPHRQVLASALAQAQALMQGRDDAPDGHRHFPGNRPSSIILLDDLSPQALGALLALHEHRVFVSGALWGINSFDQWGVELGKTLARDLHARLNGDSEGHDGGKAAPLDASTAGLLARLRGTL